jgi:hypothetical protein
VLIGGAERLGTREEASAGEDRGVGEEPMRGAQGPGDARGGQARLRSRHEYTMRRLLAAMILLLLLVLIVPRACQALLGSEDAGPGVDQGRRTPGKAAPAAGVGFSFDELSGRWSLVGMNVSCGGAPILRAISCKLLGADLL